MFASFWTAALALSMACVGYAQAPGLVPSRVNGHLPDTELFIPASQSFGEKDGLPHLNVNQLVPDSQGRIWAATQDGVAVYNGQGWTPVALPRECQSTYVRSVLPARDGALWVGTQDDGLWELRRGTWTRHDDVMGFASKRVNSILEAPGTDSNPIIVAGTSSAGVLVFRGAKWEALPGVTHPWVWRLRWDPSVPDRLWIMTAQGVALWDLKGPWTARPTCQAAGTFEISDVAWTTGPGGRRETWLSVWGQGLARDDGDRLTFETPESGLRTQNLTCLAAGPGPEGKETLWVGSYNRGLYWRAQNGRWQETEFQPGTHSRALYWILPRSGHRPALWVGFHAAGVLAVDLDGWKNVALPFSETDLTATALATLEEQGTPHYWIATSLGLVEWTGKAWRIHTKADGLPADRVETLFPTRAFGTPALLVSTLQGLALWQGGRWRPIHQPGPQWRSAIAVLGTQVNGRPGFWMGGTNWLARYAGGQWTTVTEPGGELRMLVYALRETTDRDGGTTLWVGTRGRGLWKYRDGLWSHVGSRQGFFHPSIYALETTPRPGGHFRIWAGTLGGGLGWWDSDRPNQPWQWLGTDTTPSLPSNAVVAIVLDKEGRLYLSTHRGVLRLEVPTGAEDHPARWLLTPFSLADGLPSRVCTDRGAMVDAEGRVWIGTLRGAALYDPNAKAPVEPQAPLTLNRVWVGNQEVSSDSSYQLRYFQRQITFTFSLPLYHGVQEQRFQSQLLPTEAVPSTWQALGRRELAGLAPGDYTLRLWGKDHLNRVSGPVDINIHLATPPWRRTWALMLYALAGAALVALGHRWRTRAIAQRNIELECLVDQAVGDVNRQNEKLANLNEEKNRMMGMLAHDLRNPLGAVRLLSYELAEAEGDPELPRETGKRIEAAVDRMMEMVTRLLDVTAIDTGNFTLDIQPVDAAVLLKNIAEEQGARAREKGQRILLQMEAAAPAILADSLYLKESLDNLVSNALKFMPAGPPERTLTLRLGEGWIEVEDQGPGFRPEEIERAFGRFEHLSARPTGGEPSTGLGLSIVKSLVEAMGGTVSLDSQPGQGARFHLEFLVDPDHGDRPGFAP